MGGNDLGRLLRRADDFRRIFDAAPTPYLVLSPALTVVAVNAAYLKAARRRPEDVLGQPVFTALADADAAGHLQRSLARVLDTRQSDGMALRKCSLRPPGEGAAADDERWWSPLTVPVLDEEGRRILCLIHRLEDVTAAVEFGRSLGPAATDASVPPPGACGPVDSLRLLREVAATLAGPLRGSGARLTCDRLPLVRTDRRQLERLLHELIENALRQVGGEAPAIHVSARREPGEWIFSVQAGSAGPRRQRLFALFLRRHGRPHLPAAAAGLAIDLGGRAWIDVLGPEGWTFHFALPDREAERS